MRAHVKKNSSFQVVRWFPSLPSECLEDAPTAMDIIEGPVRYRRKKKWKSRWAVLRRVNPAADVINLVLYQDQVSARSRQKEKAFISLETFAGLQLLNKLDKHYNVIIAITANQVVRLSFETIEERSEWVNCIQRHFGQEQSFDGIIPNKQKIKSGEATLRFYKDFFSLTRKDNYRLIGKWKFVDLPHYGAVYGAFAFGVKEGSSDTCIYYFATKHGRELHQLFDNVCRGGEVGTENNYVEPPALERSSPQRSVSQQDAPVSQPNFFKRTWLRISQRRRTRQRPRSQSAGEPGENRRRNRGDNKRAYRGRRLPNVPGSESNRSESTEPEVKNPDGKAGSHLVTPDGYEIMTGGEEDDVFDATNGRKRSETTKSETKVEENSRYKVSQEEKSSAEEESEHDGYVIVDGVDVEEIIKEAERRLEENNKLEEQREQQQKTAKKSKETCENEDIMEPSYEKMEIKPADEISAPQDKPGKPTTTESAEEESKKETKKEDSVKSGRNSEGYDNVDVAVSPQENEIKTNGNDSVIKTEEKKPPRSPVRPKSLESKQELLVNSNKSRRGIKNPPPELVLPQDSPERPYVNSPPKTADYVNVPGRRGTGTNSAIRSRTKTANNKPSSKKINIYDIYDGNDDSIYHSVESLMPGNPAYQNLRAESNRSHSFDNIPGHAYTNLPGHSVDGQAYQNIGPPGTQAYVNVNAPKRRFQRNQNSHHLNYIQVEGTDGSSGQNGPPSFSIPAEQHNAAAKTSSGSEYTWIDESRTRLLKETARMHSDLRKENLPKVTKKY